MRLIGLARVWRLVGAAATLAAGTLWLLSGGVWNDAGVWDDNATWED